MELYLSAQDYIRVPTGQETASLVGNLFRLSAAVDAGANAIPISPATTVALNDYDWVTLFDGNNSEMVQVAATPANSSSISLINGGTLAYAHTKGTPGCSDGTKGSLAMAIKNASDQVEQICKQSLFSQSYTEQLFLGSERAAIDSDYTLILNQDHFPATAVTGIYVQDAAGNQYTIDPSQCYFDYDGMLIKTFLSQSIQNSNYSVFSYPPFSRTSAGFVNLEYTAGFTLANLPGSVQQAATWLVTDILSDRMNPQGNFQMTSGKVHQQRFTPQGKSALYLRAEAYLREFQVKAY